MDAMVLLLVIAVFLVLVLLEVPIALALMTGGLVGILMTSGPGNAANVLGGSFFSDTAVYALFVIPMYILLGSLLSNAGIGAQIYRSVHRVLRRLPGGLAAAAVGATAMFSGISGSSAADVATMGRISVNEMTRHGYSKPYAAAVVAAAGTFANLIPPSVGLVIYAIIAEANVGRLIMAGVVPGVLSALILTFVVVLRAAFSKPEDGVGARYRLVRGAAVGAELMDPTATAFKSRKDLLGVLYAIIIFGIVVGGLYGGLFTASEAAAIGAVVSFVIAMIARPSGLSRRRIMGDSLRETADTTSMVFLLLIAGGILSFFVAREGYARDLASWTTALEVPPLAIVGVMLLLMLPLGMFLDGLSIMLITIPLFAPVVMELGFDQAWFGVLMLKMVEIALITPPIGVNVFIISGVARVPATKVFVRVLPFVLLDIAVTALFFFVPEIVLWLPTVAGL